MFLHLLQSPLLFHFVYLFVNVVFLPQAAELNSSLYIYFFLNKFIYLFILAVLGLHFCARASSSCGKRGSLITAVHGPLTIAASPVAEHRLQTRRLSSCGSRAQLLPSMRDLPRPGLEPVSPALAGRSSTTAPPGKPYIFIFDYASVFFLPLYFFVDIWEAHVKWLTLLLKRKKYYTSISR